MKILKYIFLLLLLLSVAFVVFVATQPSEYSISRSQEIKISKDIVFDFVSDSSSLSDWSPWQQNEAVFSEMNLIQNDSLFQKIIFNEQESKSFFKFKALNNSTIIIWNLRGNLDFKLKMESILSGGVDIFLGNKLEVGLNKIENYLVKELNTFTVKVDGLVTKQATNYIQQIDTCNRADFQKKSKEMLQNMLSFVKKNDIQITGLPFIDYKNKNTSKEKVIFAMCVPVQEQILTTEGSEISGGNFEEFLAVKTTLTGDYSHSEKAWNKTANFVQSNQVYEDEFGRYIEIYKVSLPNERRPSKWITEIYFPVKRKVVYEPKLVAKPKTVEQVIPLLQTPSSGVVNEAKK